MSGDHAIDCSSGCIDDSALLAQPLDHVEAAHALDDLGDERAARPGLQPFRTAGEIDARTLGYQNIHKHTIHLRECRFR